MLAEAFYGKIEFLDENTWFVKRGKRDFFLKPRLLQCNIFAILLKQFGSWINLKDKLGAVEVYEADAWVFPYSVVHMWSVTSFSLARGNTQ